jgi:hypothetical protein
MLAGGAPTLAVPFHPGAPQAGITYSHHGYHGHVREQRQKAQWQREKKLTITPAKSKTQARLQAVRITVATGSGRKRYQYFRDGGEYSNQVAVRSHPVITRRRMDQPRASQPCGLSHAEGRELERSASK